MIQTFSIISTGNLTLVFAATHNSEEGASKAEAGTSKASSSILNATLKSFWIYQFKINRIKPKNEIQNYRLKLVDSRCNTKNVVSSTIFTRSFKLFQLKG